MSTEHPFMKHLELALGQRTDLKIWRQNCGKIPIKDNRGRVLRIFDAGPPPGAADISGIMVPDGWRLEIEVKGLGGKRTVRQRLWGQFIRQSGGIYLCAHYDDDMSPEGNVTAAVLQLDAAILVRRLWDPAYRALYNKPLTPEQIAQTMRAVKARGIEVTS